MTKTHSTPFPLSFPQPFTDDLPLNPARESGDYYEFPNRVWGKVFESNNCVSKCETSDEEESWGGEWWALQSDLEVPVAYNAK